MPPHTVTVPVRIVGHNLPGLRFCGHAPVHIGLKRGREVEAISPADAKEVVFDLYVDVRPDRQGTPDYRGPYVFGLGKHDRCVGLAWGTFGPGKPFDLFRAAKLRLPPIGEELLQAAERDNVLQATVNLTDGKGAPVCARVPDTHLTWAFVPAGARPPAGR